jgi:hypothetical protein
MNQLQNFFNNFFANSEISKFNGIVLYFKEKAADNQSAAKIEELIDYLDRKASSKPRTSPGGGAAGIDPSSPPRLVVGGTSGNMPNGQDGPNKEANLIV